MAEVTYRDRLYRRAGSAAVTMSIWRTECVVCGSEFECRTLDDGHEFRPALRCPGCRQKRAKRPAGPKPEMRPFAPVEAYKDGGRG